MVKFCPAGTQSRFYDEPASSSKSHSCYSPLCYIVGAGTLSDSLPYHNTGIVLTQTGSLPSSSTRYFYPTGMIMGSVWHNSTLLLMPLLSMPLSSHAPASIARWHTTSTHTDYHTTYLYFFSSFSCHSSRCTSIVMPHLCSLKTK